MRKSLSKKNLSEKNQSQKYQNQKNRTQKKTKLIFFEKLSKITFLSNNLLTHTMHTEQRESSIQIALLT